MIPGTFKTEQTFLPTAMSHGVYLAFANMFTLRTYQIDHDLDNLDRDLPL